MRHRAVWGERWMRKALKWKRLRVFGEKLNFAEAMGYNVVKKKIRLGKISCGWFTQVINPSLNHFDLISKDEGCY